MIITGMEHFQSVCKKKLVEWYNAAYANGAGRVTQEIDLGNVFVVWSVKVLQNYKALLSTTVSGDGIYVEYTYNGDKQNLENARKEGRREGQREVTDLYYSVVCQLEKDKEVLTKALMNTSVELDDAKKEQQTIEAFAQELACWQKMADVAFYEKGNQEESSCLLDKAFALKELASKLGICGDVYARAYQIYDFRNSGKEGYTLKDGKIVKIEQEEPAVECPFVEEPAAESCEEDCTCEEIPVCCPEVSGTPDNRENICTVQGCCDEESFF